MVEGGGERVGGDVGGGGVSWVLGRSGFCFEGNGVVALGGVWRRCVWDGVWLRFGPGMGMIPCAVGYDSWELRSRRI